MHVSTPVPVGVDGQELPQAASAVAALDLEPSHGVGTEDAGLGQQLTDPPLGAEEGTFLEFELLESSVQCCNPHSHCSPCRCPRL